MDKHNFINIKEIYCPFCGKKADINWKGVDDTNGFIVKWTCGFHTFFGSIHKSYPFTK